MRDGIDEFGETAPDQADLIAIEEAREAWALTRSHGASDDPLSPPTPQNLGIQGVLGRAWDVAAGIWGSNPALICPYDDSGPSVRLVGCLNARAGCRYHEMLISVRFLKSAIVAARRACYVLAVSALVPIHFNHHGLYTYKYGCLRRFVPVYQKH